MTTAPPSPTTDSTTHSVFARLDAITSLQAEISAAHARLENIDNNSPESIDNSFTARQEGISVITTMLNQLSDLVNDFHNIPLAVPASHLTAATPTLSPPYSPLSDHLLPLPRHAKTQQPPIRREPQPVEQQPVKLSSPPQPPRDIFAAPPRHSVNLNQQ